MVLHKHAQRSEEIAINVRSSYGHREPAATWIRDLDSSPGSRGSKPSTLALRYSANRNPCMSLQLDVYSGLGIKCIVYILRKYLYHIHYAEFLPG